MNKVQEVFSRIQKSKREQKDIKLIYKDALLNHQEYQKMLDEIKVLKEKKRKIEESVKDDFRHEFNKLDTLKLDIENDQMLLADAALSRFLKGENVEVFDEKEQRYEPLFSVRFKKA